jgi:hypothetical protein
LAQKRSALVIGNAHYTGPNTIKLRNSVNDASSFATKLGRYGFDINKVTDGSLAEMRVGLNEFEHSIEKGGVALFYFAGHGIQIDGDNYLLACDTDATGENQAKYSSLSLDQIIDVLDKSGAETKIIILDACRENPFTNSWHRSNKARGLASVFAPRGTIIAFATSPGQIASDGGGKNGVYTGALVDHIDAKDCPIETVFKRVRNAVAAETDGKQVTWEHTSLSGDFYFNVGVGKAISRYKASSLTDGLFVLDPSKPSHKIIASLKNRDWYEQNPAVALITPKLLNSMNDDNLFVLGRNIYQAANGGSRSAEAFIVNFTSKTGGVNLEKTKSLLDGMLFEIFFDSNGDLRENIKGNMFEEVFDLENFTEFSSSFEFIADALASVNANFARIPGKGQSLSITVITTKHTKGRLISKIYLDSRNVFASTNSEYITDEGMPIVTRWISKSMLESELASELVIPKRLLFVTYSPQLTNDEELRYPLDWGVVR